MMPFSLRMLVPLSLYLITFPTQAFLSSAADVNRANEQAFTLLEALDVPTVYNVS